MVHSYTWHCDHLPDSTSQEGLRTSDKTKKENSQECKEEK